MSSVSNAEVRELQYRNFNDFLTQNRKSEIPQENSTLKATTLRSIINTYRVKEAYNSKSRFAYVGEQFPTELLLPFEIISLNVESIAIMLSQTSDTTRLVNSAQENNLSRDICSYLRLPYGAMIEDIYPKPNLCISNSQPCDALRKLGYMASQKYKVPFFSLDTPSQINEDSLDYLTEQMEQLIEDVQSTLNIEFDQDLFAEAVAQSNELCSYYRKAVDLLHNYSLPEISRELQEIFGMNYPGIKETTLLGKTLYEEALKIIQQENRTITKKRVLWLGQAPEQTHPLFDYLSQHVEVVFWAPMWDGTLLELDPDQPIRSIAQRAILFHWDGERMKDNVASICDKLDLDGVIVTQVWGCHNMTGISPGIRDIANERNVKHITLAVDFNDRNNFSFTYAKNRIDAFLEIL